MTLFNQHFKTCRLAAAAAAAAAVDLLPGACRGAAAGRCCVLYGRDLYHRFWTGTPLARTRMVAHYFFLPVAAAAECAHSLRLAFYSRDRTSARRAPSPLQQQQRRRRRRCRQSQLRECGTSESAAVIRICRLLVDRPDRDRRTRRHRDCRPGAQCDEQSEASGHPDGRTDRPDP